MKTIPSIIALWLTAITSLFAQAPWGTSMQRGIAAVTCGAPSQDSSGTPIPAAAAPTFGLFDLRNPAPSDYGPCNPGGPFGTVTTPLWDAPQYHHSSWNAEDLGNVFGIAIDDEQDIYVAAHGLYGVYRPLHHRYGNIGGGASSLAAAGTVYRIDAVTGIVSVFCVVPGQQSMPLSTGFNSGPGLGNITYDYDNDQFFVTSLEDGKIYRYNNLGAFQSMHDPLAPDTGAAGMPPRSDRLWAVEYEDGEVYYSVWNDGSVGSPSAIRKVTLDGSGEFIPSLDVPVINAPGQGGAAWAESCPVSDISFTLDGNTMSLGVRTMVNDTTAYNHASGTHLVQLVAGTWTHSNFQRTGCNNTDGEAYGGVAFGEEGGIQDSILWASSADMAVNNGPHGVFGVRVPDVPLNSQAPNSWKVPYMPGFTNSGAEDWKGSGGDIEIVREREDCADVFIAQINCPEDIGSPYTLDLVITHKLPNAVKYLQFKPCPSASLPTGAITGQPLPSGIITLGTPLPANTSYPISISLPGAPVSGSTYCFSVKLLDDTGAECCLEKVCVDLPPCDCAELIRSSVDCEPDPNTGLTKYTISLTVRNRTHLSALPYSFTGATFLPPAGFDQGSIVLSPASIPPNTVGTVTICYYGSAGPLCFNVSLHDGTEENCCPLLDVCVDLPPCDGHEPEPDTCGLERKVPCCPDTGTATLNFTICNNSLTPRTYTWTAMTAPTASCPIALSASDFSPSSGVIGPVAPNTCMTVTIIVNCERLEGDRPCANVVICADAGLGLPPVCCNSEVYRPTDGSVLVKHGDPAGGDPIVVGPGDTREVTFAVTNPTATEITTRLFVEEEQRRLLFVDETGAFREENFIDVTVGPGETELVRTYVTRIDNGEDTGWTSLEVYLDGSFVPALVIPAQLVGGSADKTLPKVKRIEAVTVPEASMAMQVETMPGRFYQIQQSTGLNNDWSNTECVVTDGGYASGIFEGNGSIIDCTVPCEELEDKMFFRVLRLD